MILRRYMKHVFAKKLNYLICFIILHLIVLPASGQEPIPVQEEPHHVIVHQQESLIVLDVQIESGDETLFHTHVRPIHYVFMNTSNTEIQIFGEDSNAADELSTVDELNSRIGLANTDLYNVKNPFTHKITNIDSRHFRIIAVINDGIGDEKRDVSGPQDWTKKPFSNKWFKSDRMTILPSNTTPWITATLDTVLINPDAESLKVEIKNDNHKSILLDDWLLIDKESEYKITNTNNESVSPVLVGVR